MLSSGEVFFWSGAGAAGAGAAWALSVTVGAVVVVVVYSTTPSVFDSITVIAVRFKIRMLFSSLHSTI